MAWQNIKERRETVGKVLQAGIEIRDREASVLAVLYNCSASAIRADAKFLRTPPRPGSPRYMEALLARRRSQGQAPNT